MALTAAAPAGGARSGDSKIGSSSAASAPPTDPMTELCRTILDAVDLTPDSRLADHGLHSVAAAKLVNTLREQGVRVSVRELFATLGKSWSTVINPKNIWHLDRIWPLRYYIAVSFARNCSN